MAREQEKYSTVKHRESETLSVYKLTIEMKQICRSIGTDTLLNLCRTWPLDLLFFALYFPQAN